MAGTNGAAGVNGAAGPQGPQGIPGLNWAGAWSVSNPYMKGDAVSHNGSSYIATLANYQSEPAATNPSWNLLAAAGLEGLPARRCDRSQKRVRQARRGGRTGSESPRLDPGTFISTAGCPAKSTLLGTSLLLFSPPAAKPAKSPTATVVFCQF